jgi:CBS domain-containing protein
MTDQVQCCAPETNLAAAIEIMWNNDCGALPVVEDGKLVGIITDRDICIALGTRNCAASDVMVRDVESGAVLTCEPENDLYAAMDIMQAAQVRRVPVVDRQGTLQGIVTLNDLIHGIERKRGVTLYDKVIDTAKAISKYTARKPMGLVQEELARAAAS